MNYKIAIIGCGNLGRSIAEGLIDNQSFNNKDLTVTKRDVSGLEDLAEQGVSTTSNNQRAVENANLIIVALKPYNILEVLSNLRPHIGADQVVISLASGIGLPQLEEIFGVEQKLFRAMPNIAASVKESVTCVCGTNGNQEDNKMVSDVFNCMGDTLMINEDLMDAATVLGACGIAYVMRFMRAMVQGGIQIGFSAEIAGRIVNQTVKGAAELLISGETHPESEIDKVTTPKGCTIVGLNEMEHNGFSSSLIKGIVASNNEIGA